MLKYCVEEGKQQKYNQGNRDEIDWPKIILDCLGQADIVLLDLWYGRHWLPLLLLLLLLLYGSTTMMIFFSTAVTVFHFLVATRLIRETVYIRHRMHVFNRIATTLTNGQLVWFTQNNEYQCYRFRDD